MTPQNTVTAAVATVSENTYATVQEAVDAIENEGVIVLTADTTENIEIPKGKNIIINLNGNKIINNGTLTVTDNIGEGTVDNVN